MSRSAARLTRLTGCASISATRRRLSADELPRVENEVNAFIRQNTPVETRIMTPDEARAIGAQALFGEKYGDEVRVVSMGTADTGKGSRAAPIRSNFAAAPMCAEPAISACS